MIIVTPQARAIAAFTLAVLLVMGELNRIWVALVLLLGDSYPSGRGGLLLSTLVVTAVAVLVTAFAVMALNDTGRGATWDAHVAGAGVLVAAVGLLIVVLLGFAAVIHGSTSVPSSGFGPYGL
jgi:hypothetical protein